jgi:hypothetical protein
MPPANALGKTLFRSLAEIMSQQARHICFYSNRCQTSKAFLQELALTPYKGEFQFICVDPSPNRPKIPSWLKAVPTIVVAGEAEPRQPGEVMNWLFEKKLADASKRQETAQKSDGGPGGEPMGWSMAENTSFAKGFGYSFNDSDTNTNGNGGSRIPGAFEFLQGAAAPGDRSGQDFPGPSGGQSGRQKSKKEELFDRQMEAYQMEREKGMPKAPFKQ